MPRNRGARERVATGIYRDARGFSIVVVVDGTHHERRHPHGTALQALIRLREDLGADLRRKAKRGAPAKGTLEAAARDYLSTVTAMPSYKSRRRQIELWVAVFGRRPLAGLTHVLIAAQLQRWLTTPRSDAPGAAPYSAQYVLHLHTALSHLFTTLYPDADNPLDRVPRDRPPEAEPRAIGVHAFLRVLRHYPLGSKMKARHAVMAATGLGQTELMRVRRDDLQLARRIDRAEALHGLVTARARRKGQGAAPRTIPLTRHAWRAWRLFVQLDAFGPFSTSNLRRDFRDAAKAAGFVLKDAAHPGGLDWRPYDARHTFLTAVAEASRDERAVQALGGHSDIRMVRRYTQRSVDPRVAAAIGALEGPGRRRK
jgi:integrase